MGRDGGDCESGLRPALARRAARLRYFRAELWAGGRHRFLWPPLRTSTRPERQPDLFSVGPAGLFGKLSDRARRFQASPGTRIRIRRIRGQVLRQSLRDGARDPRIHLPGRKIRLSCRDLATIEEMALERFLHAIDSGHDVTYDYVRNSVFP